MTGQMTEAQRAVQRRGLKQVWLAKKLGVSRSTLTRKLRGERTFTPEQAQVMEYLTGEDISVFLPARSVVQHEAVA